MPRDIPRGSHGVPGDAAGSGGTTGDRGDGSQGFSMVRSFFSRERRDVSVHSRKLSKLQTSSNIITKTSTPIQHFCLLNPETASLRPIPGFPRGGPEGSGGTRSARDSECVVYSVSVYIIYVCICNHICIYICIYICICRLYDRLCSPILVSCQF